MTKIKPEASGCGLSSGMGSLVIALLNLTLFAGSSIAWVIFSAPPGQAGSSYESGGPMKVIFYLALIGLILGYIGFRKTKNSCMQGIIFLGAIFNASALIIAGTRLL